MSCFPASSYAGDSKACYRINCRRKSEGGVDGRCEGNGCKADTDGELVDASAGSLLILVAGAPFF